MSADGSHLEYWATAWGYACLPKRGHTRIALLPDHLRDACAELDTVRGCCHGQVDTSRTAIGTGQQSSPPAMVYPVLVGGGVPFFPRGERRVDLELVEARSFNSGVVYLRYRVLS
jgi:hypothetical protein